MKSLEKKYEKVCNDCVEAYQAYSNGFNDDSLTFEQMTILYSCYHDKRVTKQEYESIFYYLDQHGIEKTKNELQLEINGAALIGISLKREDLIRMTVRATFLNHLKFISQ